MSSRRQLRRRGYTNLLLFVGVMAMAAVAWLDHKDRLPDRRGGSDRRAEASLVAFANARGVNTELRRRDGAWHLTMPVALGARESRVQRLLELRDADFSAGYPLAEVNREASGLDDGARLLQLDTQVYRLGDLEPISGKRYVQLEQRVLLLEDRHLPLMNGGLNAFAELRLQAPAAGAIRLDGDALAVAQATAWRDTEAMGVRAASAAPESHRRIDFEAVEAQHWRAWPEKGLWVLQPAAGGFEYLINGAQAATLGID